MPHYESGSSGSLDNSVCKRLRISSLVDMSADDNTYKLFSTACDLLDVLRSRGMETENWNIMLARLKKRMWPRSILLFGACKIKLRTPMPSKAIQLLRSRFLLSLPQPLLQQCTQLHLLRFVFHMAAMMARLLIKTVPKFQQPNQNPEFQMHARYLASVVAEPPAMAKLTRGCQTNSSKGLRNLFLNTGDLKSMVVHVFKTSPIEQLFTLP